MSHKPPVHDEDLSAEEVRQLRRRQLLRRMLVIGLPALVVLGIGTALAVPRVKEWRARQFAERATALQAEGKLQEAYNNAASAVQLRPGLPAAQRVYASVLTQGGSTEGMAVWQRMINDGTATNDDRLALAEAALRFEDAALAEREALHVLQQGEDTGRALFVLARVRLAQQRLPDALPALRESIESDGGPGPAILLARLQIAANTPESIASAVELLRPIAKQADRSGLEALMVLVVSPALKTTDGSGWVEALQLMPVGSKWKLFIPANLAYGNRATGKIPAGSALVFEVELIAVK